MSATPAQQITDTLVLPYLNHAVRMYEAGYASRADIDAAMRFGCGYPTGPLAAVEELGAAEVRDRLAALHAQTGDPAHRPAPLLEQLAAQGRSLAEHAADGADEAAALTLRHPISHVGVVGTGTMASGIVQVFAQAGYQVTCVGRSEDKVSGVRAFIDNGLSRLVAKGRLDEAARSETLARVHGSTSRADLAEVDLVVEAIAEDLELKTQLFAELDDICRHGNQGAGAILATTTSSMPITKLAEATSRPEAVIGMHFFNPATVMKLVEVVTTDATAGEVDETVRALCGTLGKVAVSCGDRAGFIVNCLLFPYLNDAVKLHESGVELAAIDAAIKEQAKFPMGPFQLLDVVGNDVSLAIQTELHAEFGEPGWEPAALLQKLVADGRLGRKTKRGFYDYD